MITLGFDASTTCVGWAFTESGIILDCGFIDTSKYEGNRQKAWAVIEIMKNNPLTEKAEVVNLEASLAGFAGAHSIVPLARWNAVFEYVLEEHFKKKINLLNVSTARKAVFGKARVKGLKSKVYVKTMIERMFDMTPWIKYNKIKNVDKHMEDVYDALVISLYTKSPFQK